MIKHKWFILFLEGRIPAVNIPVKANVPYKRACDIINSNQIILLPKTHS